MLYLLMLLSMSTTNGLLILQARQDTIKRHIRDIQMEVEGKDAKFTYQWMRGENKYKITVYKLVRKNYYKRKYALVYDGKNLYRVGIDTFGVSRMPFWSEINLSLLDWINFIPGKLTWDYEENEVIVHCKDKNNKANVFLDRKGKLLRVEFSLLGENVWLKVTKYKKVAGVDGFPIEWKVFIGGEEKVYRVYDIKANKGMCGPCTFKIPKR